MGGDPAAAVTDEGSGDLAHLGLSTEVPAAKSGRSTIEKLF